LIATPQDQSQSTLAANALYETVHRVVGNTEFKIANLDERISKLRQVLVLDPRHEKARFDLAEDLFQKGQDEEALAIMQGLVGSSNAELSRTAEQRLNRFRETRARSTQVVSPVTIAGEVSAGKDFEREFGSGLVFRLRNEMDPMTPGWRIDVVPKDSPSDTEYSWVVTLPYRGMNARYLFIGYGLTARAIVDPVPRSFRFVRNRQDYDRARANVEVLLRGTPVPAGKTPTEAFEDALADMDRIPYCAGFFRILDSTLVPSTGPHPEIINRIKFEVELCSAQRW